MKILFYWSKKPIARLCGSGDFPFTGGALSRPACTRTIFMNFLLWCAVRCCMNGTAQKRSCPKTACTYCDREMCTFWKNGYEERILQAIQKAEAKYGVSTGA